MCEEEYIDILQLTKKSKYFYQIDVNKENIKCNKIGQGEHCPYIIIQESFGYDKNFSLYSCVYTDDELYKHEVNTVPLIKLLHDNITATISVQYKKNIEEFELYYTLDNNIDFIMQKIDKDINKENIIEILLAKTIDMGIRIF